MKEITRIHLAKTAYDIEVAAKKELESYIRALDTYSGDDTEMLHDVEIRMTEILAERHVLKGGVIAEADVKVLKQQLGDPSEFMDDENVEVDSHVTERSSRKLYRDVDNAVFGGVLAGIATFFNVNALWVRLIFVLVAFASFGTALLVYVVLWLAVPPAKTAADKLQMAGRAVTLGSIRELNESEVGKNTSMSQIRRRVGLLVLGILCILGAFGSALITVVAAFAMPLSNRHHLFDVIVYSQYFLAAFILALLSGLLLATFFTLGAYSSFTQKMTKRVAITLGIVTIAGLVCFSVAVGLTQYGGLKLSEVVKENTRTVAVTLPAETKSISKLTVDSQKVVVKYIVSDDAPTATLQAVARNDNILPKVTTTVKDGTLAVAVKDMGIDCTEMWGCLGNSPIVTIYGPALTGVSASARADVDYQAQSQPELTITAGKGANVSLSTGVIDSLNLTVDESGMVSMDEATVRHLKADVKASAQVSAGIVQTLMVNDEASCPAHNPAARVTMSRVLSEQLLVNGKVSNSSKSYDNGCTVIEVESEDV